MRRDWVFMSVFLAVLGLLGGQLFAGPFQGAARESVTAPFTGGTLTSDLDLDGNDLILDTDGMIDGAGSVTIVSGDVLDFEGATILDGTTDGVLTLTNQAGTDFGRLNLGPATSSFPALKAGIALLIIRRANDSVNAGVIADQYQQESQIGTTRGFTAGINIDFVSGIGGSYAWSDNAKGILGTIDAAIVRDASGVLKLVNASAPAPTSAVGASLLALKKRTANAVSLTTTDGDHLVGITDTSSVRTVTLATSTLANGRDVIVKDESGAAGTNNITIETEGAETIDGGATAVISTNYGAARIYSDGTNWFTY